MTRNVRNLLKQLKKELLRKGGRERERNIDNLSVRMDFM